MLPGVVTTQMICLRTIFITLKMFASVVFKLTNVVINFKKSYNQSILKKYIYINSSPISKYNIYIYMIFITYHEMW